VEVGCLKHPGASTIGSQLLQCRWRPLAWLANPGNPAMSPHTEGEKIGTNHTDKTVERKGGTGEGRQLASKESPRSGKMPTLRKF